MNGLFKKTQILFSFVAVFALSASASPNYTLDKYKDLYKAYSNALVEAGQVYTASLTDTLNKQAKSLKARATRARISGNKTLQLDTKELAKILDDNLALLGEGKDLQLPEKNRPGNDRYLSIIRDAMTSATHAKSDAAAVARIKGCDKLRVLLITDGINVNSRADVVTRAWDDMVAAQHRSSERTAAGSTRGGRRFVRLETPAREELDEGEEGDVYCQSGEAKNWRRLARIEVDTERMDTISVPVFPLKTGENKMEGKAFMGGKKTVVFEAFSNFSQSPRRYTAFRVRPIGGSPRIGILTWPSSANDWMMEIRVRPRNGKSLNRCILEIGEN